MKAIALVVLVLVGATNLSAKKKVSGSGNVIKETRVAESFTEINCSGVIDVYLSQGDKEIVIVEADDNIMPLIITKFNNGVLEVKNKDGYEFERTTKLNIYITIVDLKKLRFYGVGDLECLTVLNLSTLDLSNNGVGDIALRGQANEAIINNLGVGDIDAFEFVVNKIELHNSGVGDVKVNATKEYKVINSGVGDVEYKAGASMVDIESSGVGSIKKKQ